MPEQTACLLSQLLQMLVASTQCFLSLEPLVQYCPHLWNTSDNVWRQAFERVKKTRRISNQAYSSSDQQTGP